MEPSIEERPGAQLAAVRLAKGYKIEYIAQKLRLRKLVLEQLEADDYARLPEPVFVRGYIRAYANLMDIRFEPLLLIYNRHHCVERQVERALLQTKRRDTHRAERGLRWVTTVFGIVVLIAVAMWWQKNKDSQKLFETAVAAPEKPIGNEHAEADIRLTDLSKMRSLLSSDNVTTESNTYSPLEKQSD
jgi:cytoskeleton protein RodZ